MADQDPDDTVAGDTADDTLPSDDAADTLQADAGDDTTAGTDADDTLAGAAAEDDKPPFSEFDDPAKPADKPAPAAVAAPPKDDIETQLEAVEAALEADPLDSEALKKYVTLNRQVRQRDSAVTQRIEQQTKIAAEDAEYRRFETASGLTDAPAEVRGKLTRTVVYERFAKHFNAEIAGGASPDEARGAAKATLRHEIKAVIAAAGKKKPPPARVRRTETGATLTPPGGGSGGRTVKEPVKPEDIFIKGNWTYPTPIGDVQ